MLVFSAFQRALVALAVLAAAIAASASPASARTHHGAHRHIHARHAYHHVWRAPAQPQFFSQSQYFFQLPYPRAASYPQAVYRPQVAFQRQAGYRPHAAYRPRAERRAALTRLRRFADTQASVPPHETAGGMTMSGGSSSLVMEARRYLGGNPTGRGSLWCARFANMVLERTGHRGTGSDMASSFASYGHRVSGPQVGALAVMGRRGGGHVGIITGVDSSGNPIMISGNNGNRVREAPISRGRITAYVMPD
jgi:uncharacterized protein (TIGR02594 family)